MLILFAALINAICLDIDNYEKVDCNTNGSILFSNKYLLAMSKKYRETVKLKDNYSYVYIDVYYRGCVKLGCDNCKILSMKGEECGYTVWHFNTAVQGDGVFWVKYKYDVLVFRIMEYIGICIAILVVILFIIFCVINKIREGGSEDENNKKISSSGEVDEDFSYVVNVEDVVNDENNDENVVNNASNPYSLPY